MMQDESLKEVLQKSDAETLAEAEVAVLVTRNEERV